MIYLYIKTHKITGLKYLGMTRQDPFKYSGSGLYWKSHLNKYGYLLDTKIIKECESMDEISYWGNYYSELWNIVESDNFANLVPELGENSSGMKDKNHSDETKNKIKLSLLNHKVSDETRQKIAKSLLGNIPWNKNKRGLFHHTESHKAKLKEIHLGEGNPFYGKQHSEEFIRLQRERQTTKVKCPYCDKEGSFRIMKRWHFEKCKSKEICQ
jgi:hypothetical protein